MYLKPLQHYNDEYDRMTVTLCRKLERELKDSFCKVGVKDEEMKWNRVLYGIMWFYRVEMFAGERWERKKKAVEEQMNCDRARDTLLAITEAPDPVHCLTCRARMRVVDKEIDETSPDGHDRVL